MSITDLKSQILLFIGEKYFFNIQLQRTLTYRSCIKLPLKLTDKTPIYPVPCISVTNLVLKMERLCQELKELWKSLSDVEKH